MVGAARVESTWCGSALPPVPCPGSIRTSPCSVPAWERSRALWLGVRPAVSLAVTDDLGGPPELLALIDAALALPVPHFDWNF